MGTKISELQEITELDGTEQIPVARGGANGRVSIEKLGETLLQPADGNYAGLIKGVTPNDELSVTSLEDLNFINQLVAKEGAARNRIIPLASGSNLFLLAYGSVLANLDATFYLNGNYVWGYKAEDDEDESLYEYNGIISFKGTHIVQFDAETHGTYQCYIPKGENDGNELEWVEINYSVNDLYSNIGRIINNDLGARVSNLNNSLIHEQDGYLESALELLENALATKTYSNLAQNGDVVAYLYLLIKHIAGIDTKNEVTLQ